MNLLTHDPNHGKLDVMSRANSLIEKDIEYMLSSFKTLQYTLDRMKKRYISVPEAWDKCTDALDRGWTLILQNTGGDEDEFNCTK